MAKLTRQGVRDLSYIKGKSVGRKLELPEEVNECKHLKRVAEGAAGFTQCLTCKALFDTEGRQW